MKFGVWYGMALWFVFLKALGIQPVAELSWYWIAVLVLWPNLDGIVAFFSEAIRNRFLKHRFQKCHPAA